MTTVEEVEKSEECGSLGIWWNSRKRKQAPAARGGDPSTGQMQIFLTVRKEKASAVWSADPSTGNMKINAMNCVKFVKDDATGSVKFVKVDCDWFGKIREDRDGWFVQSSNRRRRANV